MKKRKKILLAGYLNYINAQNINCVDIAKSLDQTSFDITLLRLGNNQNDLIKNEFKFYRVSKLFMKISYNISLLRAVFSQQVIYIPKHQMTYSLTLKIIKFFGVKIFTTIEGNIIHKSQKNMIDNFNGEDNFVQYFKLFNKVFPITNFIKNNNEIDFNLDNTVLRLGVSDFFFHDKTSFKVKNIIFIGNLNKSKGILELLDFVDFFPNLMFHIIGEGELKKEILKANKKNIKFYGKKNRTELAQLLRHMDINISFSKSEGFSKTILETAASGVPSIIYNLFGSNEYIVNKKNGFLASDFNDFKIILENLISGEYNLRQISNNARLLADKNKWSNVINEWEKIIYEITN